MAGGTPAGAATSVHEARVGSSGAIAAWDTAGVLPFPMFLTAAVVSNGTAYVVGNVTVDGGTSLHVVYASLGDAGLGAWTAVPVAAPAVSEFAAAAFGAHLFVIGGANPATNAATTQVLQAPLATDGAPGALATTSPLPGPAANACAVTGPKGIYVVGGDPAGGSSMAYAAVYNGAVDETGAVTWRTTTPLPTRRSGVACVVF